MVRSCNILARSIGHITSPLFKPRIYSVAVAANISEKRKEKEN